MDGSRRCTPILDLRYTKDAGRDGPRLVVYHL
jgi:hypothetical protein